MKRKEPRYFYGILTERRNQDCYPPRSAPATSQCEHRAQHRMDPTLYPVYTTSANYTANDYAPYTVNPPSPSTRPAGWQRLALDCPAYYPPDKSLLGPMELSIAPSTQILTGVSVFAIHCWPASQTTPCYSLTAQWLPAATDQGQCQRRASGAVDYPLCRPVCRTTVALCYFHLLPAIAS